MRSFNMLTPGEPVEMNGYKTANPNKATHVPNLAEEILADEEILIPA